jgi:HlyD family secretion protein
VRVVAAGTLEPAHTVEVTSEIPGRVRRVHVDYEDRVRKGATLIELDSDILSAAVEQADAQMALADAYAQQATATRDEAQLNLSRAKALSERSAGSRADIDTTNAAAVRAVAGLAAAEAQKRIARASLLVARTNLDRATIQSPIDGIVLSVAVNEGQSVGVQGPALLRLVKDLTHMRLIAEVGEADIGRVRVGDEVSFSVAAYPDRTFAAKLVQVRNLPRVRESVVTYGTVLEVDNKDGLLRPGMIATAKITSPQALTGVLLVPNAALKYRPPGVPDDHVPRVYVLKDGGPVAVTVTPRATDGTMTAVKDGDLESGAQVIVGAKAPPPPTTAAP